MVFFKEREKMKKIYLILAFLGIVLPYWAMFSSIIIDQYTVRQFFSAWFENNAVRMLAADLGVSGLSFRYLLFTDIEMVWGLILGNIF